MKCYICACVCPSAYAYVASAYAYVASENCALEIKTDNPINYLQVKIDFVSGGA